MSLDLEDFILNQMRMSHIYQPAMLKVLLENKGPATLEQVASYLLSYDQSQVEYYGLRTKAMVGKVLTSNGVVEPIKEGRKIVGYRLVSDSLTEAQRASLAHLCRDKIDDSSKVEVMPYGATGGLTVGMSLVVSGIKY
jgi:ATP adenylyltransferase